MLSAARLVVCPRPKPFVMGLPCVFVIGLLASTIRPRLPVSGADVRQIREPLVLPVTRTRCFVGEWRDLFQERFPGFRKEIQMYKSLGPFLLRGYFKTKGKLKRMARKTFYE